MRLGRFGWTVIVGIVALAVLALVSWFFVLSPRLSQAADLQAEAEQLSMANLTLRNQYNRDVGLVTQAPAAARDAQALFETMPQQADLPAVLEQITAAALDAGIKPADVGLISTTVPQPVKVAKGDDSVPTGVALATMNTSISAVGTHEQVLAFIQNLQELNRAFLITGTSFETAPDPTTGKTEESVRLEGTMFVLASRLPDLVAEVSTLLVEGGQSVSPSPGATAPANAPASAPASAAPSAAPAASSTPVQLQP